jgi:hypothetical protein
LDEPGCQKLPKIVHAIALHWPCGEVGVPALSYNFNDAREGRRRAVRNIRVLGGGPAGSAAAITALQHGAPVELVEKSIFPRPKVCGEFLSPEASGILEHLDVWGSFTALAPAKISRMVLTIGTCIKSSPLPETGWGCSRYALDHLLYQKAISLGATTTRFHTPGDPIDILAAGRKGISQKGHRLFGFKAHFRGPLDDAVELYFFDGCYVGVCAVEGGITNICGLGPESLLHRYNFDYDALVARPGPLADRLGPLERVTKWMSAGPLVFRNMFDGGPDPHVYRAGDALSFVDPFTGSGIVGALLGGRLAGRAAVHQTPAQDYLIQCKRALSLPFKVATCFRAALRFGLAEKLAPLVPTSWLFHLTRPHARS